MRFRDRRERERHMDSLERQMEHQRKLIQLTLNEKGSGRLRTTLEKLQATLPSFPRRTSVPNAEEHGATTERPQSEAPGRWWEFWR